jgi:hypothetical protein
MKNLKEQMVVSADLGLHARDGDPLNLKLGRRGQ